MPAKYRTGFSWTPCPSISTGADKPHTRCACPFWDKGSERWLEALNYRALERNAEFRIPLHASELKHIVRSVHKYTWSKFTPERYSAWQAKQGAKGGSKATNQVEAGKASGEARLRASADNRATARLMRARGMTQQAIANELGVSQRTVSNWLF